jgi:hypothetical protein
MDDRHRMAAVGLLPEDTPKDSMLATGLRVVMEIIMMHTMAHKNLPGVVLDHQHEAEPCRWMI